MSRKKTSKIVRTPTRAEGGLTDEERARMEEHVQLWIRRIMRTDPINPEKIEPAIRKLYSAAGLPQPKHVVVVPSPLVLSIASGFAAAIWYQHKHGYFSGDSAADVALRHDAATRAATGAATLAATGAATYAATGDATDAATYAATGAALTPGWARRIADRWPAHLRELMIACANHSYRMRSGGNHWGSYDCYLTAARDILGLKLPQHEKYAAWEECAIEGSWRALHPDFAMVSDFPEIIRKDEQNRPHCEDGPSHRWRDGWELYHWHGVRVPDDWIPNRKTLDPSLALTWENVEQRRALAEIIGWERVLEKVNARKVHEDSYGVLLDADLDGGTTRFVKVLCGTGRVFAIPVDSTCRTALEAVAWTYQVTPEQYAQLEVRT